MSDQARMLARAAKRDARCAAAFAAVSLAASLLTIWRAVAQ